jgi:hypothetical protein
MFFKTGNYYTGGIGTVGTTGTTGRLGFYTNTSSDNNVLIERMTILHNGFVGIANNNPLYMLHLKYGGIGFAQESPSGEAKIGFYTNLASAYIQTHNNVPMHFATNNATAQMTLTTAGRLGIGTTAPASRLDVKGKIIATQQSGEDAALEINGNLKVTGLNPAAYVVTAAQQDEIVLDHPAANGHPNALIFVTHQLVSGDYFNGSFSVKYNTSIQKWIIKPTGGHVNMIHEEIAFRACDGSCIDYIQAPSMSDNYLPIGTKFNVLIIAN